MYNISNKKYNKTNKGDFLMKISDMNPHISYAKIHRTYFSANKDMSKCYDCRIFFFNDVIGTATVSEEEYSIINKTAIFFPPETEYKFNVTFKENGSAVVMDFDLDQRHVNLKSSIGTATVSSFDESILPNYDATEELSKPIVRIIPQLERMLIQCTENFIFKNQFYRENSSALLKLCLLEFIKQNSAHHQSELCEKVISFIHDNFSNSNLTNRNIAENFNYHPYHLSRIFKEETGKTLHKYLIFYRLQIAKNFLLTTKHDISAIAWRSGFRTSAYFIKIFKENIGMTPKEYRNLQIHTEI